MKNLYFLISAVLLIFISCETERDEKEFLKFYGDAREDIGYSVAMAADGYVVCGKASVISRTPQAGIIADSSRMVILKAGFDGNTIWKKFFGGNLEGLGQKVVVFDDGSIVSTGYVIDKKHGAVETDIFVVKVNSDGSGPVEKVYPSSGNQAGLDILRTSEGYLVLGTTDIAQTEDNTTGNIRGNKDILLLRLNNALDTIQRVAPLGFPGNDIGVSIKKDVGDGYIIVGTTDKFDPERANNNIFLWRVNREGNATEPAFFGSDDDEYAADLEVLTNGYLITGTIGKAASKQSVYVSRINSDIYADPLTSVKIEKNESWSVSAMSRYGANYFVLAGKAGTTVSSKMLLFAVDSEGNQVDGKEVISGGAGIQVAFDVMSDPEGYLIAVGKSSYQSNSMISLMKFRF